MSAWNLLEMLAFEKSWNVFDIEEGDSPDLLNKKAHWLGFKLDHWSQVANDVIHHPQDNLTSDHFDLLIESLSRAVGSILAFRRRDIVVQISEDFRQSAQNVLVASEDRVSQEIQPNVYRLGFMLEIAASPNGQFGGFKRVMREEESGKIFDEDGKRMIQFDPKKILKSKEDYKAGKTFTLKQLREKNKAIMSNIKAIAFDVFGTLLDWKGTIVYEARRLLPYHCFDREKFATAWMQSYGESLAKLKENGAWAPLDSLLEASFEKLVLEFGIEGHPELKHVWNRLDPFPDVSKGLARLKGKFRLAAFTNANQKMLEGLAKHTKLPWHKLISVEPVRAYKPDPAVYRLAIETIGFAPNEILMVASHTFDLNAASKAGMQTALITRKGEPGSSPGGLNHGANAIVGDVEELAEYLLS